LPVLQLLCSTRAVTSGNATHGHGPLDLSWQVALPNSMAGITHAGWGLQRSCARRSGAEPRRSTATARSRGGSTGSPSCCGLGWSCARTPPAQRKGGPGLAPTTPTQQLGWPNGVGGSTPRPARLHAELGLQRAGHQPRAGPLPGGGDALFQLLLAGRSNDPESSHRPCPRPSALATYQLVPTLPGGAGRLEAPLGPTRADRRAGAHAGGNRFCHPRPGATGVRC